jgi:hypothetical protein
MRAVRTSLDLLSSKTHCAAVSSNEISLKKEEETVLAEVTLPESQKPQACPQFHPPLTVIHTCHGQRVRGL